MLNKNKMMPAEHLSRNLNVLFESSGFMLYGYTIYVILYIIALTFRFFAKYDLSSRCLYIEKHEEKSMSKVYVVRKKRNIFIEKKHVQRNGKKKRGMIHRLCKNTNNELFYKMLIFMETFIDMKYLKTKSKYFQTILHRYGIKQYYMALGFISHHTPKA
ncbi:hypothetical protein G5I_02045 [Acromyrmex echinatior]|uniref:Uncharacterized protein n=1 Tax=Acromyrmex echinatior TaxID=103372 RepID=F4W997_ACREC|nr:hypothetical protein G5I_02045 [Acromyrmex echinatior]